MGVTLRDVEVGGIRTNVRIDYGRVVAIGPEVSPTHDDAVVDGVGGALLRGLRDEHVHVLAVAAQRASVVVDASVNDALTFTAAMRTASRSGPVRAVGYHERVAGSLDRDRLDEIVSQVPCRVQHRTGGLWILNSAALRSLGLDQSDDVRIERNRTGRATGRLWRADDLVRDDREAPAVAQVGLELLRYGVTGITDASPSNDTSSAAMLGSLPQHVRMMASLDIDATTATAHGVELGEVKVILDDHSLPEFDLMVALIREAHQQRRGVALHCVTLTQLWFALEALRTAGSARDRIEHASVAPPDAIETMRELGVAVTTQPAFLAIRGDDYLRDVDPRDIPALYPNGSLIAAGLKVLGSSDAPYGPIDPWLAMSAAVRRATPSGAVLTESERIEPRTALALYGATHAVVPGIAADLALLACPLVDALRRLNAADVRMTFIRGTPLYEDR